MLEKFPGLLGYNGIIAIHADWPNYPLGIGWEYALKALGNFPLHTEFFEIDDIDRCKLLINQNPEKLKDAFDYSYYHVAIWHEDLVQLKRMGFLEGVFEKSDYEFKLYQFEKTKQAFGETAKTDEVGNLIFYFKDETGNYIETKFPIPNINDYEDQDFNSYIDRNCAIIPDKTSLTEKGHQKLIELSQNIEFSNELKNLVEPLLSIERYDTAIREASLLLESTIKKFHNTTKFGQKLIDFHFEEIKKHNADFSSAAIKHYRSELRTIFSFIRNDFAHNFKVITKEQCKAIIYRISQSLNEFEDVKRAYFNS